MREDSLINISALERKAGIPEGTMHHYLKDVPTRKARTAKWWAIMRALCPVIIGGHLYTFDEESKMFMAYCLASPEEPQHESIEVKSPTGGSYFVDYYAVYSSIIDDDYSFVDWFGTNADNNTIITAEAE